MGPKKTTKKKARGTRETAEEKLSREADLFEKETNLHDAFLRRINHWMLDNHGRAIDLFRKFDVDGSGSLSYGEFFSGMRDLDAPCTQLELYVLARNIDSNRDGNIDYKEFSRGLKYERPVKTVVDDGLPVLKIYRDEFEKCPHCKIARWNPATLTQLRYICLEVHLTSLLQVRSYPGHFQVFVHSHMLVEGIRDMIRERHGYSFLKMTISYENKDGDKIPLPLNQSLQECGFPGGTHEEPQLVKLYYDFDSEMNSCPLLQCDHYFTYEKPAREGSKCNS